MFWAAVLIQGTQLRSWTLIIQVQGGKQTSWMTVKIFVCTMVMLLMVESVVGNSDN